jgi:uncharacterized protein (TIGR02145 family)
MAENLNIGTRVDGTGPTADQSNNSVIEKYCYGDLDTNCTTDGGLYQWAEAMGFPSACNVMSLTDCGQTIVLLNHQGICPTGWRMPNATDWLTLTLALRRTASTVGATMKLKSTTFTSWDANTYNDGNSSGFSGLPAGRRYSNGGFGNHGINAGFWEASEISASDAIYLSLYFDSAKHLANIDYKTFGFSVRCLRDN